MDISKRLEFIANHIDKCESIIDVGTDHGPSIEHAPVILNERLLR